MSSHHSVLLLFFFFLSVTSQRCNPDDYKTLMKIKNALNNPYHLASWAPNTDCCSWYCRNHQPGRRAHHLLGSGFGPNPIRSRRPTLPREPHLPETHQHHLKFLRLSWLNLTGPLPGFLSELANLTFLELNYNKFTGSIPPSYSKFTNLGAIRLDRNQLTGTIPESFGHFSGQVPDLYLSHNLLTGSIPKSFADIDFSTIDLSRNKLAGDASMLFKPNGSTQTIDISRNMFEFDFSVIKFAKSLISLDINHNKIYGSIPKDILTIGYFQFFNVSYNRLCGEIPSGGDVARFDESTYIHNKCLCGPPLSTACK